MCILEGCSIDFFKGLNMLQIYVALKVVQPVFSPHVTKIYSTWLHSHVMWRLQEKMSVLTQQLWLWLSGCQTMCHQFKLKITILGQISLDILETLKHYNTSTYWACEGCRRFHQLSLNEAFPLFSGCELANTLDGTWMLCGALALLSSIRLLRRQAGLVDSSLLAWLFCPFFAAMQYGPSAICIPLSI